MSETTTRPARRALLLLVSGQILSSIGTGATQVAIPLLVFELTHSATSLGITAALGFLPYPTLGLVIGALADRVDRRTAMIVADSGRAVLLLAASVLGLYGGASIATLYVLAFLHTTLSIYFDSCLFAVIPKVVDKSQLVAVNGRLQAGLTAGRLGGRAVAGAVMLLWSTWALLAIDGLSFLLSAAFIIAMGRIVTSGDVAGRARATISKVFADVREGLRYVWGDRVLRRLSIAIALSNVIGATAAAQIVLFLAERFHATDSQVAWMFVAGAGGTIVLSMSANFLRNHAPLGMVAFWAVTVQGLALVLLVLDRSYWLALPLWALHSGTGLMLAVYTGSLRQAVVPPELMGRVSSISQVLAWSGIPVGTLVGGLLISVSHQTGAVYAGIGVALFVVGVVLIVPALRGVDLSRATRPSIPAPARGAANPEKQVQR